MTQELNSWEIYQGKDGKSRLLHSDTPLRPAVKVFRIFGTRFGHTQIRTPQYLPEFCQVNSECEYQTRSEV